MTIALTDEYLIVIIEDHVRELLGHTVTGDHLTGNTVAVLKVRRSTCADLAQDDLLCGTSAQRDHNGIDKLFLRCIVDVLIRLVRGITAGTACRDDGYSLDVLGLGNRTEYDRVSCLVESGQALFLVGDDTALLLRSYHDLKDGLGNVSLRDLLRVTAGCQESCLVKKVRKIGTCVTGSDLRDLLKIDIVLERLILCVYFQDVRTALDVRTGNRDTTVETSRTQERRVKDIDTVCCRDNDNALIRTETVHLNEQLVQCLLALIVTAAHAGTTVTTYGIDLIDEDDARRILLRAVEKVSYTACTDTDEHFNEVGTGNAEERNARLTCYGLCQQSLTCTRRAVKEDALRDLRAERGILLRVLKEVNDLREFFFFFVRTGNIREVDLVLGRVEKLRLGSAEVHRGSAFTCVSAEVDPDEEYHRADHQEDHDARHDRGNVCRLLVLEALDRAGLFGFHEDRQNVVLGFVRNLLADFLLLSGLRILVLERKRVAV